MLSFTYRMSDSIGFATIEKIINITNINYVLDKNNNSILFTGSISECCITHSMLNDAIIRARTLKIYLKRC